MKPVEIPRYVPYLFVLRVQLETGEQANALADELGHAAGEWLFERRYGERSPVAVVPVEVERYIEVQQ